LAGDSWERFLRNGKMGYVHIDDVAHCHVLVYEDDTAQGRYLCTSSTLDTLELADFLAKRYPWLPIPSRLVPRMILKQMVGFSKLLVGHFKK